MCVCVCCSGQIAHVEIRGDNKLLILSDHVDPGKQSQISRSGSSCLYPLSHLANPFSKFYSEYLMQLGIQPYADILREGH